MQCLLLALKLSSTGWDSNNNDYVPFLENFLSKQDLDRRFADLNSGRIAKKARTEATRLNGLTPISKAEICKILPDISPSTVEAILGAMIRSSTDYAIHSKITKTMTMVLTHMDSGFI